MRKIVYVSFPLFLNCASQPLLERAMMMLLLLLLPRVHNNNNHSNIHFLHQQQETDRTEIAEAACCSFSACDQFYVSNRAVAAVMTRYLVDAMSFLLLFLFFIFRSSSCFSFRCCCYYCDFLFYSFYLPLFIDRYIPCSFVVTDACVCAKCSWY